jgi:transposase
MRLLETTRQDRRRLERQLKDAPTVRVYRRTLALLEIMDGRTVADVARSLRMSREAVYRWVELYTESRDPASLFDRPMPGRPSFWSDEMQAILCDALAQSPDALGYLAVSWTVDLLREHVEKEGGRKLSSATVRRQLHCLDYAWKRPRHALRDSKSPRVRRRLRFLRRKVRSLATGSAKLFEDETDLLLFPPLRAGWFPRGKVARVPISGANAKRTIFGTIDVDTGHRIFVARDSPCAVDHQALLRLIRAEYGRRKVALLLDRASRHTAEESQGLAAKLDIELLWLPSRCVNVNPMDRLWEAGKDRMCANKQHTCIDHQAQLFIEYLHSLSPQQALKRAGILSKKFWLFR